MVKTCLSDIATIYKILKFNESQIQPSTSTWCGQFAIFFLFERLHNLDFKYHDLVNLLFTDNLDHNQKKVESFFEEILEDGALAY